MEHGATEICVLVFVSLLISTLVLRFVFREHSEQYLGDGGKRDAGVVLLLLCILWATSFRFVPFDVHGGHL